MSIFCLGGKEEVVPMDKIRAIDEAKIFLPGVIHGGEDYIIQVYGYLLGKEADDARIEATYLFVKDILEWAKESIKIEEFKEKCFDELFDPECFDVDGFYKIFDEEHFVELINENAESFIIDNDGTGNFHTLNKEWENAVFMTSQDIIDWARKKDKKCIR